VTRRSGSASCERSTADRVFVSERAGPIAGEPPDATRLNHADAAKTQRDHLNSEERIKTGS
jgi:hypothetical protein